MGRRAAAQVTHGCAHGETTGENYSLGGGSSNELAATPTAADGEGTSTVESGTASAPDAPPAHPIPAREWGTSGKVPNREASFLAEPMLAVSEATPGVPNGMKSQGSVMVEPSALPDLSAFDLGENTPETCRDGSTLPVCPAPREHRTLASHPSCRSDAAPQHKDSDAASVARVLEVGASPNKQNCPTPWQLAVGTLSRLRAEARRPAATAAALGRSDRCSLPR